MAEGPDDLFKKLQAVDRTICGVCKRKLVGLSFLANVDGKMVSLCSSCKHTMSKKKPV